MHGTYEVSYAKLNDAEVEESVGESISVVVLALSFAPPISSTPPIRDLQLECRWRGCCSWRDFSQTPSLRFRATQLVWVVWPPQLSRPSWVWRCRGSGRGGTLQFMGTPSADNTSAELSTSDGPLLRPPVTSNTETSISIKSSSNQALRSETFQNLTLSTAAVCRAVIVTT